jgi:predicted RNA-binding Zn ribbon-like protein
VWSTVSSSPRYNVPKAAPAPLRLVQLFVNTSDREHEREWLSDPPALEAWCREHDVPAVAVTDADLLTARSLREALRAMLRGNGGEPVDPAAFAVVNKAAAAAILTARLDARGGLTFTPLAPGFEGTLGRLVAVAFSSMVDGTWPRLKACRQCLWSFYDYSRNRSARWCSMSLCGNRIKTRAYRLRSLPLDQGSGF